MNNGLYIGIDLGTSGVRATAIDTHGDSQGWARSDTLPPRIQGKHCEQDAHLWWLGVEDVLGKLCKDINPSKVRGLSVDGTSSTLLLTDPHGTPLSPALMYNDARSSLQAKRIANIAPQQSAVHGANSSLSKLLYLLKHQSQTPAYALHQADWILRKLGVNQHISDTNNVAKLGYDSVQQTWPQWIKRLGIDLNLLPKVVSPGRIIGHTSPELKKHFGLDCSLVSGTTDSTAAFIATGASKVGEAVTSLGSTMVMKVLSEQAIFAPKYGVYSQALGDLWLVGGASNSGGAVLSQHFCRGELQALSERVNPDQPTDLDYYPLPGIGERFPIADPNLKPQMTPRPEDDLVFFQAILEGMSRIESQAYALLKELGAPYPVSIRSAGGGAHNKPWTRMRETRLKVPLITPDKQEAAYGTALLARKPFL